MHNRCLISIVLFRDSHSSQNTRVELVERGNWKKCTSITYQTCVSGTGREWWYFVDVYKRKNTQWKENREKQYSDVSIWDLEKKNYQNYNKKFSKSYFSKKLQRNSIEQIDYILLELTIFFFLNFYRQLRIIYKK